MRKVVSVFFSFLASAMILFGLLFLSVEIMAFNESFYYTEYVKLESPAVIGISETDLMDITHDLIGYLKGDSASFNRRAMIRGEERVVFSEKEVRHMDDVMGLFLLGRLLKNIAFASAAVLLLLVMLSGSWQSAAWNAGVGFLVAGAAAVALLFTAGYLVMNQFSDLFFRFHEVLFSNDLWLLNPDTDVLIQMFPTQFFVDIAVAIGTVFGAFVVGLTLLSVVGIYFGGRESRLALEDEN